ncbi:PD-(D/E)XK nuclease family protein [Clostridium vitabionis]|uniref:PD-(D/E)XK nuclease family protein n=1 Tax=Clostridium vitabionis TaxID=2784388 RepID=UPI00188C857E|nr:PD-(D/E)XK nuclease family protein [Clostridium vitabionis]
MSYRFCFGPSGAGKTRLLQSRMLERAEDALRAFARGGENGEAAAFPHFLYVIPEQYSMQTQMDLVTRSASRGIMNVDVLSFARMAYRIFGETGADERSVLSGVGRGLLVRRAAAKHKKDLHVLADRIDRVGYISSIQAILTEFMQYQLSPEDVGEMADFAAANGQRALEARLRDLIVIYRGFLEEEKDRFMTGEERLGILAEQIPKSETVRDSVVVIDGFTDFTPVQYRVIASLLLSAKEVVISLTFGEDGGPEPAEIRADSRPAEQELFSLSRLTAAKIMRLAEELRVPHSAEPDIVPAGDVPGRFQGNSALAFLEKSLFRFPTAEYRGKAAGAVAVWSAKDPEAEVRRMCALISRMAKEEGYAYRDFGVIVGDLDQYQNLVWTVAAEYGLPVYIDTTRQIIHNPVIEAVRSALSIAAGDFSYEMVFRYLRSGLSGLAPRDVDILENYCLEHGISSRSRWAAPFANEEMEVFRKQFLEEIEPIRLTGKHTAGERTEALYAFLVHIGAEEKIRAFAEAFEQAGDTVRAQEFDQIYRAVVNLMDQIFDLTGAEEIGAAEYLELMEAGLSEISLGTVPRLADRILVGDVQRTRMNEVKVLFFLGANDGNVPKNTSQGGFISDLEREFLLTFRDELAPTPRQKMYMQRLHIYLNLTRCTDRLYVSYAASDTDGSALRPSYMIGLLLRMFPDIREEKPEELPVTEQIAGSADAHRVLAGQIRSYADGAMKAGSEEEREFLTLYGVLAADDLAKGPAEAPKMTVWRMRKAAFLRYDPKPITGETVEKLYHGNLYGSVSSMETAAQCYLRYFLQRGLGLTERRLFTFESSDRGTVMHDSVKKFGELLRERHLRWQDISDSEGKALVREALAGAVNGYRGDLLTVSSRRRAQTVRMERLLERTVRTIRAQLRAGVFTPVLFEYLFGISGEYILPLENGGTLRMLGRIDRVDLYVELPGGQPESAEESTKLPEGLDGGSVVHVKIVDYKSGMQKPDFDRMAAGLQVQLLIYMDVMCREISRRNPKARVVPSAVLYSWFHDPVLRDKDAVFAAVPAGEDDAGRNAGRREKAEREAEALALPALTRALRPTGLVCGEEIGNLDRTLAADPAARASDYIPAAKNKSADGKPVTYRKSEKVLTGRSFELLMKTVRDAVAEIAQNILAGNITASPVILDAGTSACTWCPYAGACGFDPRIPGCSRRIVEKWDRGVLAPSAGDAPSPRGSGKPDAGKVADGRPGQPERGSGKPDAGKER